MTRLYIQPSWIDSCLDHGEWSGGNDQYRGDKSIEAVPTYINGKPNVKAFSDEAIEARKEKKKTSVPLKQRILPQAARVEKLRSEILELETAYRAGDFSLEDYSVYRDVAFAKLQRAEVLYKKAVSVKPTRFDDEMPEEYPEVEAVFYATNHVNPAIHTSTWVDELPPSNSLKVPLQKTLHIARTLVRWHQKARSYWNELKAV